MPNKCLMFDVASELDFEPRAYELAAFFASRPEEVAFNDLERRLSQFSIAAASEEAVEACLSALDVTLSSVVRTQYILALEGLLSEHDLGTELQRRLLGVPLEIDDKALHSAQLMARGTKSVLALDALIDFESARPLALRLFNWISQRVRMQFDEASSLLVLECVNRSFIVGDIASGTLNAEDHELIEPRITEILRSVPGEINNLKVASLLADLVRLKKINREPVVKSYGGVIYQSSSAFDSLNAIHGSKPSELRQSFAMLLESLYDAGSLNDDARRWDYLLKFALLAKPANEQLWTKTKDSLAQSGEFVEAKIVDDFIAELGRISVADMRVWKSADQFLSEPISIKGLLKGRVESTQMMSLKVHARARIEGKAPNDWSPKTLLRQLVALSRINGHQAALASLKEAAQKEREERGNLHEGWPALTMPVIYDSETSGIHYIIGSTPLTPELLLQRMIEFAKACSSKSVAASIAEMIDEQAPLAAEERSNFAYRLEMSHFYIFHRDTIERLRSVTPELLFLLIGKLIITSSGGMDVIPSRRTHLLS